MNIDSLSLFKCYGASRNVKKIHEMHLKPEHQWRLLKKGSNQN